MVNALARLSLALLVSVTLPVARAVSQSASADPRATTVVQQAVAAIGGADRLAGVKDFVSRGQITVQSPMGEVSGEILAEVLYPDKTRSVLKLAMGEMVQAFDGKAGWMKMGAPPMDIPDALLPELRRGIVTAGGIDLLRKAASGEAQLSPLDTIDVGGRKAEGISWKVGDVEMKAYYDAETHLLAKLAFRANSPQGSADVEVLPSDFRDAGGLKVPYKMLSTQNGQKYLEMIATEIKVNAGVDPASFAKPAQ